MQSPGKEQYDNLDFQAKTANEYGNTYHLGITLINQVPLLDIIEKYERQSAESMGHEYNGPGYEYQCSINLYCQLMEKSSCASSNEPALMICTCLEEGCWPFLVTITETDESVVWSRFHNHHMTNGKGKNWDYSCFPTYTFEKKAYDIALGKLRSIAESQPDKFGTPPKDEVLRLLQLYADIKKGCI